MSALFKTVVQNQLLLRSTADHYTIQVALNPYEDINNQPNREKANLELEMLDGLLEQIGAHVQHVPGPAGCPDGNYPANWGVVIEGKIFPARLPAGRSQEEPYARKVFRTHEWFRDNAVVSLPIEHRLFSGQGDVLVVGDTIFCGVGFRTTPGVPEFLSRQLPSYTVVTLRAKADQPETINPNTGLPNSHFYDTDLGIAVIRPDLLAWCPEAYTPATQAQMRKLGFELIDVSLKEALAGGLNLISTGVGVVMNNEAPELYDQIVAHGLKVLTASIPEIKKGGGGIRCSYITARQRD